MFGSAVLGCYFWDYPPPPASGNNVWPPSDEMEQRRLSMDCQTQLQRLRETDTSDGENLFDALNITGPTNAANRPTGDVQGVLGIMRLVGCYYGVPAGGLPLGHLVTPGDDEKPPAEKKLPAEILA